ncbi:MAG: winged helix-turn-helix domain-containing protein, partial [Anaerolineales bacterium]|nr:winged helix-turn-helix domain-containing protein [Anaerolineales bacterium]
MNNLSLALLGPFQATLDDKPITQFRTKSVQALLIFLACEAERPYPREQLMELLWPGMPQASAQANMRQTLYRLRKLIPEVKGQRGDTVPLLLTDRQTLQINPDASYTLDVDDFAASEPLPAIGLYRGDFLADFYLPDSEAFEEWASARRAAYKRQVLELMEGETAVHLQSARYDQAIQLAQRQIEIDNLRENSHRQLMEAWARNGRRREALSHYQTLRQLLQDELAIEPEPETRRLLEAIRSGELSQAPA